MQIVVPKALAGGLLLALAAPIQAQIDVEIVAGDNIIVDSNVLSPSTYAPETFTVQVTYCNNTAAPISDIYAHIGNIDGGGATAATPGTYPVRDSDTDAAFQAESPHLANTGDYFITHAAVQADTTRYIGTLNPGQCVTLYWMLCYPKLSNTGTEPVWGESRLDDDDLWLEMDAWASRLSAGTIDPGNSVGEDTHEVTMRRSISAMANKVSGPTGAVWTVTDLSGNPLDAAAPAKPGQVIKVCGTGFNLGVDNKGYDSDANFAPDYAVWLQPVGDKNLYDPLCFRLVRTEGQLRISRSGGNPTYVLDFVDETYFTDLPNDTNGGVGDVCYYLVAMSGPCSMALSPYQMVASGADNEKFNGDFGAASPGVDTGESPVTFSKSVDLDSAAAGTALTYDILLSNPAGEDPLGLPEYGMPLVVNEQIPAGTSYVAGSAEGVVAGETTANYNDSGGFMDVLYSTDDGLSYTITEPGDPTQVTHIQWRLDSKLQGGDSAFVQFQVAIADPFSGSSPLIENTAGLSFGNGPQFREDQAGTLLTGNNSLDGKVWKDSDRDGTLNGGETGIQDVEVSLYFDVDGDGVIDEEDPLIATRDTAADGTYSFGNLPDGNFIAAVDTSDPQLPAGGSLPDSVAATRAADLDSAGASPAGVAILDADWPFLEALAITKSTSPTVYRAGELVTYQIDLQNFKAPPICDEIVAWGSNVVLNEFAEPPPGANAADGDNGTYAEGTWAGDSDGIDINQFDVSALNSGIAKVEALVNLYIGPNALDNDDASIIVPDGLGGTVSYPLTEVDLNAFAPGAGAEATLAVDITGSRAAWDTATFTDPGFYVRFQADKQTNDDRETAFIDAVGIRITCDGSGASFGPSPSSIDPLPLTDSYDPARLQFMSASIAPDSVDAVGGTLTWNNVGPLHAGARKTIEVTFLALDPPDAGTDGEPDPVDTTNTAASTGALFLGGNPANEANDTQDITINPGGAIGDYIYWDVDGLGTQDAGDLPLQGVVVELTDGGGTVIATTTTDANGFYRFAALADGTYTVRVASTNFDPNGTLEGFSQTDDPDATSDNESTFIIDSNDGNPANDSHDMADFGYDMANNVVSGTLWYDHDGDGLQDPNEPPITGYSVGLDTDDDGTPDVFTTTDTDGFYSFSDVVDGTYDVIVTGPAGTVLTTPETVAGGPADLEVDADSAGAIDGAGFPGNGFGFQPSGSLTLGDTLYVDWDGDGIQGPGEEGLANITVSLYADVDGNGAYEPSVDALVSTVVTDAGGNYQFGDLATNDDYLVVVDTNDADFPSSLSQTDDPDGTLDSVGVATGLAASDDTHDFGYQPLGSGSIGDTVFVDADGDGIHDAGEAGIANITVTLYEDSDGDGRITTADAVVATAVTDADGRYLFESLAPGDYLVDVDGTDADLPTGLASDGVTVLNYIPTSSDPHAVTLGAGAPYAGADFGFASGGGIGNFVWEDLDGDGEFDDTEPPLAGMTANLYEDVDGDGIYTPGTDLLVDSTTTDADGLYFFDTYNDGGTNTGLPAGDYLVEIEITATQAVTYDFDGNNDEIAPVTLLPGQNFGAADYGVTDSSTLVIGETVWLDSDGDGLVGANETLLGGVKVELLDGSGTVIDTAYTDSLGNFMFGVPDDGSTYSVRVDESTLPFAGLANTTDRDGDLDSDSGQFTMVAGTDVLDAGFAYQLQGDYDLTGTVFNDTDSSATWESGSEPTYEDVTVYLWYSPDGGATWINVDSQLTGPNGSYRFEGYPPGDYTLSVSPGSPVLIGTDPTTPQNQQVTVADGDMGVDFGFVGTSSIGDTVFYDTDGDGTQDAGELGIPGIQVTLAYPNGQTVTTTSDANGNYVFEGLGEGPHTITVNAGTLPAGTNQTADPDGTNDSSTLVNLLEGQNFTDGDFGYQAPGEGSIGDRIWADLDSDGAYEPGAGEFGLEGVSVELYDANDPARDEPGVDPPLATTTTDADGLYGFAGLSAGDYIVHMADTGGALDGYDATFDEDGGTVSPDGQAAVHLPANDTMHDTADFGYSPNYASISGTVYDDNDSSNDGVINPADDGAISGVTIELWSDPNRDGDPGDGVVVASTVTDSDGNYQFDSLLPGDYVVVERDPAGFTSDADTGGLNDNQVPIDLQGVDTSGNSFLDDGGSLYTVGGQVTDGSDPIPGVTVTLKDGNGNVIGTAVTDANGDYGFPNLPAGDYLLEETNPAGTTGGSDTDGGDPDVIAITGLGGDSLTNNFVDTGFTRESISGTVYNDTLENNLIDPAGDTPIGGVTLELVSDTNGNGVADAGEPVIATTLSGTDGGYSFDGLPQGDYAVVENDPSGATSENDTGGLPADNNVGVTLDGTGDSSGNAFLDDGVATSTISGQVTNGTHPIPGVTITLKNDQGSVITTTLTDSNGEYSFPNLPDGDYMIEETNPDRTIGGSDSDGSANGDDTIAVTLTGGSGSSGNDFVDLRSKAQDYDEFLVDTGLVGGTADAQPVPDGTGTGGNPDGDNASNLVEYALCNDPNSGLISHQGFCVELADPASGQIEASFTRPEGVVDVIYTLQGSNDLLGAWTDVATIAAGDAAAAPFTVASNGDGSETVTLGDVSSTTVGGAAGLTADFGLLRLRVSLDVDQDGTPDTLPSDGTEATDYTATFGYQGTDCNAAQCATFGSPFSRKPVFSGTVDAIAGALVNVSTAAAGADLSGDIAGTGAFYLQVTSGFHEGERWDIASAGVDSLTLVDDSDIFSETTGGASLNTSDGVPSNADLAGASFEVLPHRTLDDLFDKNGAFAGLEGDPLTGARLLIYDNRLDTPQWIMLILLNDGGTVKWVRADDLAAKTDQGGMPVSRCMGNFIHPLTGGLTQFAVGVVAGHDLACAFNEGLNLGGALWPLDQTAAGPNGRALTLANGLVGGKSPNLGAELYFWNGDDAVDLSATYVEGYESNFLIDFPGYQYWTDINDRNVPDMNASIMLPRHRAFLLKLMEGNSVQPLVAPVPAP